MEEGVFAALVAIGLSVFVSSLAYTLQCSAQFACVQDGTCRPTPGGSCSFANVVSPIGYRIFNTSADAVALATFTRGVCAPGERQSTDQFGRLECVRAFSYPDAFVDEIAFVDDVGSSAKPDHERACGRWIHAGATPANDSPPEYFAFYDADAVQSDVHDSIKDDVELLHASQSDVGRFVASCKAMVVNSAVAPAASIAYDFLKDEVGTIATRTDALHALGRLAARYCDGPIAMGLTFHPGGQNQFAVRMEDGVLFGSDDASESLYDVGERSDVRDRVRAFVDEMQTAPSSMLVAPTNQQLGDVVDGALRGTWVEDSLTINAPVAVATGDGGLGMLSTFLYAVEETSGAHAQAYLQAMASQCAMSVRSVVTGEFGTNAAAARTAGRARSRRRRRAKALGRLALDDELVDRFAPVNATHVFEASSTSWSMLTRPASALFETSPQQASATCWGAAMVAFPDALDRRVFDKLVAPRVASNILPPLVSALKTAVANAIESGRVSQLVASPSDRAAMAAQARSVAFRVAGAPRTSAFGRQDAFERPLLDSNDGALLVLLKQAKAVFLDRLRLALDGSSLCQHPPLFPSSERNAYLLTAAPCAMLLPGILVPPFVSDRYDEASLYGRIGFVIAHEVAHVTSKPFAWSASGAAALLANYSESTWAEAAADLIAAEALVASGMLTPERVCEHVSQLWCARVPSGYPGAGAASHPPANRRGDNVCSFLRINAF